jgi:hypothetical protein
LPTLCLQHVTSALVELPPAVAGGSQGLLDGHTLALGSLGGLREVELGEFALAAQRCLFFLLTLPLGALQVFGSLLQRLGGAPE